MQTNGAINEKNQYVVIGKVLDTYGLKGELKVQPYLRPEAWKDIKRVFLKRKGGDYVPFKVASLKFHGKERIILHFEGCEDVTQAEGFKGAKIFLPKEELPKKKKDEYYYFELEGLEVYTEKGTNLGRITGVIEQKPYDLLEVDSGRLYIPFVKALVKQVNLKENKLIVDEKLSEL